MSKTLLLALGLALTIPATAQDIGKTPAEAAKTHEVGAFHNSVISSNVNNSLIMAGVQYKHWVKPNTAYRTLASYAKYSIHDMRPSGKPSQNDTMYSVFSNTNVNMAFIGAGVEMQGHFYKKVYLFAALELRGGTGRGFSEDMEATQVRQPGNNNYYMTGDLRPLSTANVKMTYVGFVPSIGAKLQFKTVSFGVELSPLEMSYKSLNTNGVSNGLMDFNIGTFSNRFFINFRF